MEATVKLFTFVIPLAGSRYGGHIPASSFEEVKRLIPTAEDIGELVSEEYVGKLCSGCGGELRLEVVTDEWAEEIE